MSSRRSASQPPVERPQLRLTRDEAGEKIQARIAIGKQLLDRGVTDQESYENLSSDYYTWHDGNRALLRQLFTTDEFADNYWRTISIGRPTGPLSRLVVDRREDIGDKVRRLEGIVEQLAFVDVVARPPQRATEAAPSVRVLRILSRFHRVVRRLRVRHDARPTLDVADEYDVQDLLAALLYVDFDDVRAEEWTPSYAGGSSRIDFLLKDHKIVVESKVASRGHAERAVRDELAIDLIRYRAHPDCRTLICFVYDPSGAIGNPEGLRGDLERASTDELRVVVVVNPT